MKKPAELLQTYKSRAKADQPEIWITYHPYCKAPDWIGPLVSREFGIPYLTVEAVKTGQGGPDDEWAPWRTEAQAGIRQADMHLVFKPTDWSYLESILGSGDKLRDFPPFMDTHIAQADSARLPENWASNIPVMVTAGMMRKGKKDSNFYILAEALCGLVTESWNLVVIGGGPEEDNIRAAFSSIPENRVHWTGQIDHSLVPGWMKASDIFIWPGWKEPIGMVYLEAQLQGVPVVAYESMGVPLVVQHGKTGLLAPEGDLPTLQENIRRLLVDSKLRQEMGVAAIAKVVQEHSIESAAERLNEMLREFD